MWVLNSGGNYLLYFLKIILIIIGVCLNMATAALAAVSVNPLDSLRVKLLRLIMMMPNIAINAIDENIFLMIRFVVLIFWVTRDFV